MKYPSGKQVQLGDAVWWNEGCGIGCVHNILESQKEQRKWGQEESCIVIGRFPIESSQGFVVLDEACFVDEGIERLSKTENIELKERFELAASRLDSPIDVSACSYWAQIDAKHNEIVEYSISFVDANQNIVAVIPTM